MFLVGFLLLFHKSVCLVCIYAVSRKNMCGTGVSYLHAHKVMGLRIKYMNGINGACQDIININIPLIDIFIVLRRIT